MIIRDKVKILPPFNESYSDIYTVELIDENGGIFVEGIIGGFDVMYVEKV